MPGYNSSIACRQRRRKFQKHFRSVESVLEAFYSSLAVGQKKLVFVPSKFLRHLMVENLTATQVIWNNLPGSRVDPRPRQLQGNKSCSNHDTQAEKKMSDTVIEKEALAKLNAETEAKLSKERNDHQMLKDEFISAQC